MDITPHPWYPGTTRQEQEREGIAVAMRTHVVTTRVTDRGGITWVDDVPVTAGSWPRAVGEVVRGLLQGLDGEELVAAAWRNVLGEWMPLRLAGSGEEPGDDE